MRYLFKFITKGVQGYVYFADIEANNILKIQLDDKPWHELSIEYIVMSKHFGEKHIHLDRNNLGCEHMYIPSTSLEDEFPCIYINKRMFALENLDIKEFKFDEDNNPIPPPSSIEHHATLENYYDFDGFKHWMEKNLSRYEVDFSSNIFEHTMMQLAGIKFPFYGRYKRYGDTYTPHSFFIKLDLFKETTAALAHYFNQTYGEGIAEYDPGLNRVRFPIKVFMEKILPDFEKKLAETFLVPRIQEIYQKPYKRLDKALKNVLVTRFPPVDQYSFDNLVEYLRLILQKYKITLASDVIEHTMLQLAGITAFPFDGKYIIDQSAQAPEYLRLNLSISQEKMITFINYFNQNYGAGTVELTPQFDNESALAVQFPVKAFFEKILPDLEDKFADIFSDIKMQEAYQKPFKYLDNNLKRHLLNKFSTSTNWLSFSLWGEENKNLPQEEAVNNTYQSGSWCNLI
ncbi:Uncharacterised protein [Legionella beliardensis]|uniref:Uncharacterized protein n=1 Tax=Legionella beliardensis TaxID=91822 RepID=A0A378I651_9GAMM|nr:hypothetical protein [Legionella beliardensis]STX30216.1 Uncharacterised protein [Legionella beliardensis]